MDVGRAVVAGVDQVENAVESKDSDHRLEKKEQQGMLTLLGLRTFYYDGDYPRGDRNRKRVFL